MQVDPEQIEHQLGVKREAKAARRALTEPLPESGAVATFPVAVFAPGSREDRNDHYWSYAVSREPGSLFLPGVTAVSYRGAVGSIRFHGWFHVVVGDVDPTSVPAASATLTGPDGAERTGRRRPAWARALPTNQGLAARPGAGLERALRRAARRETAATERLLTTARPFVDQIADSFDSQIRHRRAYLDRDDVVNEGWRRVYHVCETFSGPERPGVPWSTALYRNCRRDMARAVHALDGVSEAVSTIRATWAAHPSVTDAPGLERVLAVQAETRRLARRHPGRTEAQLHALAAQTSTAAPFSRQQVEWAMAVPRVIRWSDPAGFDEPVVAGPAPGSEDPGLAAVEAPARAVAEELVAATGADPDALLDVMTDLGVATGGRPARADLLRLRRSLLTPFILPGERPSSPEVLCRAGHRARSRLFCGDQLLRGERLATAWRRGVTPEDPTGERPPPARTAGPPAPSADPARASAGATPPR